MSGQDRSNLTTMLPPKRASALRCLAALIRTVHSIRFSLNSAYSSLLIVWGDVSFFMSILTLTKTLIAAMKQQSPIRKIGKKGMRL